MTAWSGAEVDDQYRINTLYHKTIDKFSALPEVTIDNMVAKLSPWQEAAQVSPAWRGAEVDDKYRINTLYDQKIDEFDGPSDFYDTFDVISAKWFAINANAVIELDKSTAGLNSMKITTTSPALAGVIYDPTGSMSWPDRSIIFFVMLDDDAIVNATDGLRISVVGSAGGLSACNYGSNDGLVSGVWASVRCDLSAPFDLEEGGGADMSSIDRIELSINYVNPLSGRIFNVDAFSVVPNAVDTIERMVAARTPWTEAALA